MEFIKNPHFEFLGKAKYFFVLSGLLVAAGIYVAVSGHLTYGVEFSGGTQLILRFQNPPAIDKIRDAVNPVAPGAVIQTYGPLADHKVPRLFSVTAVNTWSSPNCRSRISSTRAK